MYRSMRFVSFLLLVIMGTASLFTTPYLAKAQAEEPAGGSFLGHIVQAGEDLESIAATYHTTAAALAQENQLSMPVELVPGQLLRIHSWESQPAAPGSSSAEPAAPEGSPQAESQPLPSGEKWIEVDLSEQTLTAHQGDTLVKSFAISSGVASHPTVTGTFHIWAKVAQQDMTGGSRALGDYYYTVDVPWVQYFHADYSIHGAYWHNNFGHPMSHGCINMRVEDSHWLFDWAAPSMDTAMVTSGGWLFPSEEGTRVEVHE